MAARFACALCTFALLGLPTLAFGQGKAPNVSKEQRQALMAAVTAVKNATDLPASDDGWQFHLLRASDGSHYVAFSVTAPDEIAPDASLVLYVRLAPRPPDQATTVTVVRSAVEEWLLGQRNDPLPMRATRVVQVPSGELPVGGTYATLSRDGSGQNSAALALIERERQRQRDAAEAAERERKAEMERGARNPPTLMPFEDFDLAARVTTRSGRLPVIRRALTAGPGDYDLLIGWAVLDSRQRPTKTGVLKHALHLPTTTGGLELGSVILADAIGTRSELYRSDQQTAHPYTIGTTEIEPASDTVFTNDERLSVAFQVFGATPSPTGKPDVSVGFRLFRLTEKGEQLAASLTPLEYSEGTLPVDFNLLLGHPILAAMAAPLRTLPRGEYRLAVAATDRLARSSATADARFRIVATPAALLAGAPAYSARVRRTRFIDPDVLEPALDALPGAAQTAAVAPLIAMARERRFVTLLPDSAVPASDRGMGLLLQAVARFALGDTPSTVANQFRRALEAGAPAAPTHYWLGASRAADGKDEEALAAWDEARKAGWPATLLSTFEAEALVRLNRLAEAGARARTAIDRGDPDVTLRHIAAAADITGGRFEGAVETLSSVVEAAPDDAESQWLLLHALFASAVKEERPGATPEGRARFLDLARAYIDGGGRHRAVAEEWRDYLISSWASP